jgi:hypothetical protein
VVNKENRWERERGGGINLIGLSLLLFLVFCSGKVAVIKAYGSIAMEIHCQLFPYTARQAPLCCLKIVLERIRDTGGGEGEQREGGRGWGRKGSREESRGSERER